MQKSVSHLLQASSSPRPLKSPTELLIHSIICIRRVILMRAGSQSLCHLICKHAAHRGSDAMHDNVFPPATEKKMLPDPPPPLRHLREGIR